MIVFGSESRNKIKKGVDTLANAVKVTLGPKGRNVAIQHPPRAPHITKDGVTVARAVEVDDPIEALGAQLIKDVAHKTCLEVGDATTTSCVLAQAIYNEGLKYIIDNNINLAEVKNGIQQTVDTVTSYLDESCMIIKKEDKQLLKHVAMVSSNQDVFLSELLSDTISKIGEEGVITIEDSRDSSTFVEITEGLQLDKGYMNTYFATDDKEQCVLNNCKILAVDGGISNDKQILPVLDACAKSRQSLLIICDSMEPKALSLVLNNTLQHKIKACVIFSPGFGVSRKYKLEDLLAVVGGELWSEGSAYNLGSATKVIVSSDKTIIIGGNGSPENLVQKVSQLRALIEENHNETLITGVLQSRLAALTNGVAVLNVGANSEIELKEKKDRAEDTIRALQSALQEGVIIGGGTEYVKAAKLLKETDDMDKYSSTDAYLGKAIISSALLAPTSQICINAGLNPSKAIFLIENVFDFANKGFNAATNQIEDLFQSGIIDSKKAAVASLVNAASVASSLLTTECVIIKQDKIPLIGNEYNN